MASRAGRRILLAGTGIALASMGLGARCCAGRDLLPATG